MSTPVRRRLAAAALVLLVPALGACGFGVQTDQVYQPSVGSNDRADSVNVLGAVVVHTSDGKGTFVASLVNTDDENDDELTAISGDGLTGTLVKPVPLPAGTLTNLADSGAVAVVGDRVQNGNFVRLTLEFQSGQKTTMNVPVVPHTMEYADVSSANTSSAPTP